MSISFIRVVIALFLVAHGLVHVSLATVPTPAPGALRTPFWPGWWRADVDAHWMVMRLGLPADLARLAGWVLWAAAALFFTLAGAGILGAPLLNAVWPAFTLAGSLASLLLLGFYGHPWLVCGVLIDLAAVAAVVFQQPGFLFNLRLG